MEHPLINCRIPPEVCRLGAGEEELFIQRLAVHLVDATLSNDAVYRWWRRVLVYPAFLVVVLAFVSSKLLDEAVLVPDRQEVATEGAVGFAVYVHIVRDSDNVGLVKPRLKLMARTERVSRCVQPLRSHCLHQRDVLVRRIVHR